MTSFALEQTMKLIDSLDLGKLNSEKKTNTNPCFIDWRKKPLNMSLLRWDGEFAREVMPVEVMPTPSRDGLDRSWIERLTLLRTSFGAQFLELTYLRIRSETLIMILTLSLKCL